MSVRFVMTGVFVALLAIPAYADCKLELQALDQALLAAETGAGTAEPGAPATKHQEQVLSPQKEDGQNSSAGGTTGAVEAESPHQKQVTGTGSGSNADALTKIVKEAKSRADAGDEKGCMKKVTEAKTLLGTK